MLRSKLRCRGRLQKKEPGAIKYRMKFGVRALSARLNATNVAGIAASADRKILFIVAGILASPASARPNAARSKDFGAAKSDFAGLSVERIILGLHTWRQSPKTSCLPAKRKRR